MKIQKYKQAKLFAFQEFTLDKSNCLTPKDQGLFSAKKHLELPFL